MYNHPQIIAVLKDVIGDLIGLDKIVEPEPDMGAEDFGFFIQDIPGAMFFLGCEIEGEPRRHHDSRFDINEDCLPIGAAVLASTAIRLFDQHHMKTKGV